MYIYKYIYTYIAQNLQLMDNLSLLLHGINLKNAWPKMICNFLRVYIRCAFVLNDGQNSIKKSLLLDRLQSFRDLEP